MAFFQKLLSGNPNKKILKALQKTVEQINNVEQEFKQKTDDQLRQLILDFKKESINQSSNTEAQTKRLDQILPPVYATVREAAKRTLKQRHYDVQIVGAITLHQGNIAEMKTGEGKTLASTMPICLNGLLGRGVHIVTVNDYLSRRDASWMGQIYNFLGLRVACLQNLGQSFIYDEKARREDKVKSSQDIDLSAISSAFKVDMDYLRVCTRKEAYQADITYGTNSEFGFDYLRDNMVYELSQKVQRGHYYAIIDEVDSILIDEARTPLIISSPDKKSAELYKKFAHLVSMLKENEHYNVDEERHAATLTEEGIKKIEMFLNVQNIYTEDVTLAHQLDQALKAYALYKIDKDYVVKNGEIIIVDQFTGRLQPGRRYSQGLHQAIEAKEGVEIKEESKTLATITIQNYFRMYEKLAGMTGTAATEAEEFHKIYNLNAVEAPTNKPLIRKDYEDVIYKTEKSKFNILAEKIKEKYEIGQPVLVGTISIEKNERLSKILEKKGIPHTVLNAKHHEKEAEIIAQAGKLKAVTVATNMAGRGVDIVLGGNPPDKKEAETVRSLSGLCVFGSERHEARRIDNQLRGRAGRQGDPGESRFFISLEDDLMRVFGSDRIKNIMDKLGLPDDMPIENKLISHSIEKAQQKVEGYNFDIRKHLVEYDDVINKQRSTIYRRRDEILNLISEGKPLEHLIFDIVKKEIKHILEFHVTKNNLNIKEIQETFKSIPLYINDDEFKIISYDTLEKTVDIFYKIAKEQYQTLSKDLKPELKANIEKILLLQSIDRLWIDHLDAVEHLRVGIGLRGYGQRDPLVEYKREAFDMYQTFLAEIERNVAYNIYKIFITYQKMQDKIFSSNSYLPQAQDIDSVKKRKVGRNDPCWCGRTDSFGKSVKYKRCHGK